MDKFFRDQPNNNFEVNNTLTTSEPGALREKMNLLNESFLLENPEYKEDSERINYELLQLDNKWANSAMEFEKIFNSNLLDKDILLENKQNEIDKITKEVEEKEYELVSLRINGKKALILKMMHNN